MDLQIPLWMWLLYHGVIISLIAIDLIVGIRRGHAITFQEALRWVLLWVSIGMAFGLLVLLSFGGGAAGLYFAVYFLEYTLSMDNLFVFALIFTYFRVPQVAVPVVLYAGILGAIVMRASFIYGGIWLLEQFYWMVFVFGAALLYSGLKIWKGVGERMDVGKNPLVRLVKRFLPISDSYSGTSFIIRGSDRLMFTPLIVVLLAVESTDIMFAFDSVPAALAITNEFFLAYTGNVSAILGLRSLYFLLAHTMLRFKYVSKALAFILVYLGLKFILSGLDIHIPLIVSLMLIFTILGGAIVASLLLAKEKGKVAAQHQ